jgi:hypothetical protein
MDHLKTNKRRDIFELGFYDVNTNFEILEVAKDINMSMKQLAVLCGMEAYFANTTRGYDLISEDEFAETILVKTILWVS